MPCLARESRRLLPSAPADDEPRRRRVARRDPAHRLGDARLRLAAHHEAQQRIEGFIERVYNEKRLHSALDYRPPNEYEQWLLDQQTPEGVAG